MPLVSVQDLRDEGVTLAEASDARLQRACAMAQRIIEIYTGRWFEAREFPSDAPLEVDSVGGQTTLLPVPIIRLDEVWEGDTQLDLSAVSFLTVYDQSSYPSKIFNPSITKRSIPGASFPGFEVYGGPGTRATALTRPVWLPGRGMVRLVGSFGFVDRDGVSPPPDIKMAAIMTALRWKRSPNDPLFRVDNFSSGATSESTDGHSYSIGQGLVISSGPTFDPLIDDVIRRYRRMNGGGNTRTRP